MKATSLPWLDQQVAARVRAHMPSESTVDLDRHAAQIGKVVAEAELTRLARSVQRDTVRILEAELVERLRVV